MSTEKSKKIERRGGAREGTGPKPDSGVMTKISVSVTERSWDNALSIWWKRKPKRTKSRLVDRLVQQYARTDGSILKMEAAI